MSTPIRPQRPTAAGDYTRAGSSPAPRPGHALNLPTFVRRARDALARHPALLGILAAAALWPLDGPLGRLARAVPVGGDLRRELEALGQFGALSSLIIIAWIIWQLDPRRRPRLLDGAAALVITGLVVSVCKMLAGRPRPRFDDPAVLPGPFGAYPIGPGQGVAHGWEIWRIGTYDLGSMPSSHAAYAAVAATCLALLYPKLRALMVTLAALVAASRVLFAAHWPTDVVVGAALGVDIGRRAMRRCWGRRLLARCRPRRPSSH